VEASAVQAPAAIPRARVSVAPPLLRLRSDDQLVALFRAGHDEAFRVIHDRYRQRLFAYTRQMLPARQDAEDALQDVFVRAYSGLRANRGKLVLKAWLYRVAHNRCIDELRRPTPPPPELLEMVRPPVHDPIAAADQRESLRRLVADVRRLPEQQRSALLMRELTGMSYADVAAALGVTVPAVKSLLVRARITLAQASEARDTACSDIRGQLTLAHDRGVRPGGTARRHMRDCNGCRHFHRELRGVSRRFAALAPTLGPLGVLAKVLGFGGGGGAAAGGAAAGGAAGTGAIASAGVFAGGAGHVATLIAAAVVTAGGAVEIQQQVSTSPAAHHRHHSKPAAAAPPGRHEMAVVSRARPADVQAATRATSASTPERAHLVAVPQTATAEAKPAGAAAKTPAAGPLHHGATAPKSAPVDPSRSGQAGNRSDPGWGRSGSATVTPLNLTDSPPSTTTTSTDTGATGSTPSSTAQPATGTNPSSAGGGAPTSSQTPPQTSAPGANGAPSTTVQPVMTNPSPTPAPVTIGS
jgi:RNA polymerase sigma factor (sigma-70 family)